MGVLSGRVALVTGGTRGIGREIARAFAAEGATVVVCGRDADRTARAARELGVAGVAADVTDPSAVAGLARALDARGGASILVNNAAVLLDRGRALFELPLDDFDATLATNVRGPFLLARALVPGMIARGYGRIVNLTSGLAAGFLPRYGAYGMSKAALETFTRVLALELRDLGDLLVNALDPGVARTDMYPTAPTPASASAPAAVHLAALPRGGPSGLVFKRDLTAREAA